MNYAVNDRVGFGIKNTSGIFNAGFGTISEIDGLLQIYVTGDNGVTRRYNYDGTEFADSSEMRLIDLVELQNAISIQKIEDEMRRNFNNIIQITDRCENVPSGCYIYSAYDLDEIAINVAALRKLIE